MTRPLAILVLAAAVFATNPAGAASCGAPVGTAATTVHPWAGLHRDAGNTDYFPLASPRTLRYERHSLPGPAVLTAAVVAKDGRVYVATGLEEGTPNLYAYNADGSLVWSRAGPDHGAALSSPLIDEARDVYLGDIDQVWAWHPNGALKWVVTIPAPVLSLVPLGGTKMVGVSINGDVLALDSTDGHMLAATLGLTGIPPPRSPVPPGLWQGQYDPSIIDDGFALFMGEGYLVTATPAADPARGRFFVPTTDGNLYRIDLRAGTLQVAFQSPIGPGSGTSPALSPGGDTVYVVDGGGTLYAIDSNTGARRWERNQGTTVGSPTVASDGSIYTLAGTELVALSPGGQLRWRREIASEAAGLIPNRVPGVPVTGRFDSVLTATPGRLYVAASAGYNVTTTSGNQVFVVQQTVLYTLSPDTGANVSPPVPLPDTSDAVVSLGVDGRVYVTHGSIATSVAYNGLRQYLPAALVPPPPAGGFSVLAPASFRELGADRAGQALCAARSAQGPLQQGAKNDALRALQFARDVTSSLGVVLDAGAGEIPDVDRATAFERLDTAARWLDLAIRLAGDSGNLRARLLARVCTAAAVSNLAALQSALD